MNFYKQAALALDHLDTKQGSVKGSLAFAGVEEGSGKEGKRVLALVIETLKFKPTLRALAESVNLLVIERKTFPLKVPAGAPSSLNLTNVLLYDLLFSKEAKIHASDKWPPKAAVARHGTRLKAELVRLQIKKGVKDKSELKVDATTAEDAIPRYVRCNTNIIPLHTLIKTLTSAPLSFTQLQIPAYPPPPKTFFSDPHLPNELLAFPYTVKFDKNQNYLDGGIILQDKASCFPAKVLMHGWEEGEGEIIDGTAAPGNKTTYLSALMGNKGRIHAFERSHNRYKTLQKMVATAKCKNVDARRADFLESKADDFKGVTRILLDPSCSGSGIVNRLDYLLEQDAEDEDVKLERLEKLAGFQLQMIRHAMKFSNVRRIVYSTCSVHPEEDEEVVLKALESPEASETIKGQGRWTLAPREEVLPSWERRGRVISMDGNKELAESLIRCVPGEDHTNGFFVSCFVRSCEPHLGKQVEGTTVGTDGDGKKRKAAEEAEGKPEAGVPVEAIPDKAHAQVDAGRVAGGEAEGNIRQETDAQANKRRKKNKRKKGGAGGPVEES